MRQIVAPVALLALLIAPTIGDLLARSADACAVAPCCIGKMSKSCPMHAHPSRNGFGMRSCGPDEQVAVAHLAVAILAARIAAQTPVAQPLAHRNPATPSYFLAPPPDPPPPRLS